MWLALIGSLGLIVTATFWWQLQKKQHRKIRVTLQPLPQNNDIMTGQLLLRNVSGLVFRRTEFIDALRQVPRVVLTRMDQLLVAEGQLQEPLLRSHGAYQVPEGLALRQVTLDQCRRITLDGSAFLHMGLELGLVMSQCQEIKMRNQRLSKLHLRLTNGCQVDLENVCCDVVIVEMLGTPSVVRGLHVCQLLHYTAERPGSQLLQLGMRPHARVTRDPRSHDSVELECLQLSPERRPSAAPASDFVALPIFVPELGLVATHLTAPTPRSYSTRLADPLECHCAICLVNYANSMTNCQHQVFCTSCLPRVIAHDANKICPVCRTPLRQIASFDAPAPIEGPSLATASHRRTAPHRSWSSVVACCCIKRNVHLQGTIGAHASVVLAHLWSKLLLAHLLPLGHAEDVQRG
jgi:hypothetical protein